MGTYAQVTTRLPGHAVLERRSAANGKFRQVYAEVVAGLSALTALLLLIPAILRFALVWAWNVVLFVLWITLFGLFGRVCVSHAHCWFPPSGKVRS